MIITDVEFEAHFDEYFELATKEKIIITKNNKRVVMLVPINDVREDAKFTVDDIHNIRYENHESNKDLTSEQKIEKTRLESEVGRKIIEEFRNKQNE